MYRILIADDEGIVRDSLKFIIEQNFQDKCEIQMAKSGRMVIETAQEFMPDIALLDIQMPGLNGIDAMKEIRMNNQKMVFVVISAYDRFGFAKEALALGAMDYIVKPFTKQQIVTTLEAAMKSVDEARKKRSSELIIREKLQAVIPVIESGFINQILMQDDCIGEAEKYLELMEIPEQYGFMMTLVFGERGAQGELENVIGSSVKMQNQTAYIQEMVREAFPKSVVSSMMANKFILFLPWHEAAMEFETRSSLIEKARNLVHQLQKQMNLYFRIGIGNVWPIFQLHISNEEAQKALRIGRGSVVHIQDMQLGCIYEANYPVELEEQLFQYVDEGNTEKALNVANRFFDWMIDNYADYPKDIQTKALEFVMQAEKEAFLKGGMQYGLLYRKDYLDTVISCKNFDELRRWFIEKLRNASNSVAKKAETQSNTISGKAKAYIAEHFNKELSLEEVAKYVDISPYYFSKLFKEEEGKNFIEYVTDLRIQKAMELLKKPDSSIKDICISAGYSDPNYFSRIFKKATGCTPTEYREGKRNEKVE